MPTIVKNRPISLTSDVLYVPISVYEGALRIIKKLENQFYRDQSGSLTNTSSFLLQSGKTSGTSYKIYIESNYTTGVYNIAGFEIITELS